MKTWRAALFVPSMAMALAGCWAQRNPQQTRQELFDEVQPVALETCQLERLGEANDGGYLVCGNLLGSVEAGYSYENAGGHAHHITRRGFTPVGGVSHILVLVSAIHQFDYVQHCHSSGYSASLRELLPAASRIQQMSYGKSSLSFVRMACYKAAYDDNIRSKGDNLG